MTKKQCVDCGRVGKQVTARDGNKSQWYTKKRGARRCVCRKGKGCLK